jgi:hypothetical protein
MQRQDVLENGLGMLTLDLHLADKVFQRKESDGVQSRRDNREDQEGRCRDGCQSESGQEESRQWRGLVLIKDALIKNLYG